MTRSSTLVKPESARMLRATVLRRELVSPSMVRITAGGPGLDALTPLGFDQWFRMLVPRPGQEELRLPPDLTLRGYLRYATMNAATRPLLRNYTFRAIRPGEIDIDLVVHPAADPSAFSAAAWAQRCEIGSPLGVLDEGIMFAAPPRAESLLLVADESGLPAVAGVLAALPRDARGLALVEVPTPEDVQDLEAPEGVEVRWLPRHEPTGAAHDEHAVPGRLAAAAAASCTWPEGRPYAFVVGETGMTAAVRRHLVTERGLAKTDVAFCGYWKHGAKPAR
ncbi:siderophore-interacting protein [Cellulomonas sp. DKR-3]|uniref:Siderophore-interacting protein n=1 Tax=Cellulomonas fulva TaxID=2835530 RepID=A0ABS5TZ80_9CELL|nr:siderophore-interacting protein [Cellulomonas fulva]MBT0994459.1 siderophore-interacting protein [Cellulomonas fulva]